MSDTWIRDMLHDATEIPPGISIDVERINGAGSRSRRRRHQGRAAIAFGATLGVAVIAVAGAGLANSPAHPRQAVTLGTAATPPGDQAAGFYYTHESDSQTSPNAGKATTVVRTTSSWLGHTASSVSITDPPLEGQPDRQEGMPFRDNGFNLPGEIAVVPAGSKETPREIEPPYNGPVLHWDDMWSLPQTAAGLKAYYLDHTPAGRTSDQVFQLWVMALTKEPGPATLKLAAISALQAMPGSTTSTGTDSLGRTSTIVTVVQSTEIDTIYFDPHTGEDLQFDIKGTTSPYNSTDVYDKIAYTNDDTNAP